jgi:hypothetical protein
MVNECNKPIWYGQSFFKVFGNNREMSERKSFVGVVLTTFELIEEKKILLDVDLMIALDFTPTTWKIWKPKLIQKLTNYTRRKMDVEKDDHTRIRINYFKKEDVWKSEEFLE